MSVQRSFAAGEVSPALFGRADVDRWKTALQTCRNFIVMPEGGITTRPGFQHGGTLEGVTPADFRAVPFEFGPSDSHVLLFDGTSMYVVNAGFYVNGFNTVFDCSLSKAASPWTVTHTANHGLTTGDTVNVIGIGEYVVTVTGLTTYTLDGSSGGSGTLTVDVINTTYTSDPLTVAFACDQTQLRWVQSGDTLYVTDGVNAPRKIVREYLDDGAVERYKSWRVSDAALTPEIISGVTVTITPVAGSDQIRYRITRTDKDGKESGVLRGTNTTGTATLSGDRWSIAATTHTLETNDTIEITEDKSNTDGEITYRIGDLVRVIKTDANNFTVVGNGAVSGNFKYRKLGDSELGATPSSTNTVTVSWTAVADTDYYNVYREFGRVYGYIGSTSGLTFTDKGIIPDQRDTPVVGIDPTRAVGEDDESIPLAVGLFQQRLVYGGFSQDTERVVASHVGNYSAFDPGAEDASGVDFILAGRGVSNIKHMLEIAGRSILLTSTAEWMLRGNSSGSLTPTAINARAESYNGTTDVPPAVVGNNLIYVQKGGRVISDARYDFSQESLASRDLTLWAKHLFNAEITRVVYQRSEQVVWVLLEDGQVLGITYIPDQEVWGWHRHDIGQDVRVYDLCVVSEGNRDRLYAIAETGTTSLTILRLPLIEHTLETVDDFLGYDLGYSIDGSIATGTWTLTGGTNWTTDESLTLTTDVTHLYFGIGWDGSVFLLRIGEERVYVRRTARVSDTVMTVEPLTVVPEALRGVGVTDKGFCTETVSFSGGPFIGAWSGRTLVLRTDGSVEHDPELPGGVLTLEYPAMRIQLGLAPTCRAQTLDVESTDRDSLMGDFRHVTRVRLRVVDSRGCKAGLSESTLEPILPTFAVLSNAPPELQDGVHEVLMDAAHDEDGSVLIAQDDGLPTTVTNIRVLFNIGEGR